MQRIHAVNASLEDNLRYVAIAIHRKGGHIGVLYKVQKDSTAKFLDLPGPFQLRNIDPQEAYFWIDPKLPSPRLKQVAATCRKIWRANTKREKGDIPYAFSSPIDCFGEEASQYLLSQDNLGLTCSTFVLAVFHTAKLPLIQYSTWAIRKGDAKKQKDLIDMLYDENNTESVDLEAIKDQIGTCVRFRPEDVAGAATSDEIPTDFETASYAGLQLLDYINSQTPTP